jgi:hypothetical protein
MSRRVVFAMIGLFGLFVIAALINDANTQRNVGDSVRWKVAVVPPGEAGPANDGTTVIVREASIIGEFGNFRLVVGIPVFPGLASGQEPDNRRQALILDGSDLAISGAIVSIEGERIGDGSSSPDEWLLHTLPPEAASAVAFTEAGRREIEVFVDPTSGVHLIAVASVDGDPLHGVQVRSANGDLLAALSTG